jgi:hypothetical protein
LDLLVLTILSQAHHFIYTEYPTLNKGEKMPTKVIVDCSTGITTEVELTAEEIKEQAAAQKASEAEAKAQEIIAKAKNKAKADLLDRLGLTAEEAALLIS